jgi:hypothetical protein
VGVAGVQQNLPGRQIEHTPDRRLQAIRVFTRKEEQIKADNQLRLAFLLQVEQTQVEIVVDGICRTILITDAKTRKAGTDGWGDPGSGETCAHPNTPVGRAVWPTVAA